MANITKEEVAGWFSISESALEGATMIYGYYTYEDYSGDAFVLFQRDGKLWEVNGSHCSCYGLEDQWGPEETSIAALKLRRTWDDNIKKALSNWKAVTRRRSKKEGK